MEKTVEQGNDAIEEKTFSQAEVDAIVGDRLKRERAKVADYDTLKAKAEKYDELEENAKSELQKAVEKRDALQAEVDNLKRANAVRDLRVSVADEMGVPASLLTAETDEDCRAQAKAILEFAGTRGYPAVRDAGEAPKGSKGTTREQFAEWARQAFGTR